MAKFHINPVGGDVGECSASLRECPFGSEEEHYPTAEAARKAYEEKAEDFEDSGRVWPPPGLPKRLHAIATSADLIRHFNDTHFDGGEGVCLGVSAFISHKLIEQEIPHELVRGQYITESGEKKAHWWIESRGWIIDASRGQFDEPRYRSGVIRSKKENYQKLEAFEPGHKTMELVERELKGCFMYEADAYGYLDEITSIHEEAERLASNL